MTLGSTIGFPYVWAGMIGNMSAKVLIDQAKELTRSLSSLSFSDPVTHVYNPLEHAWSPHRQYLERYGKGKKKVIFLGMNPGPWGMTQTGVPFGEVELVRNWMGIEAKVKAPKHENPSRRVEGFDCKRSEVSGRRLWGYFSERFPKAEDFFKDHFVLNHCPLVFMEASGRNRTPDKLPLSESGPLTEICDRHLEPCVETLKPEVLVGVGGYATKVLRRVFGDERYRIETLLHPSPASPIANRGWEAQAHQQLKKMGLV